LKFDIYLVTDLFVAIYHFDEFISSNLFDRCLFDYWTKKIKI